MTHREHARLSASASTVLALIWSASAAHAQTAQTAAPPSMAASTQQQQPATTDSATENDGIADIIVTAQKRSENINRIGISITAATADTLRSLGVNDARDLGKLVPGFTYTESSLNSPVYTIRGVGYYETSLAATPAVTVYVDQIPLTYPQMTRNAAFDLERVEVLKGPQGTLFGQNSTGGAVNYIAAKPTDALHAGFDISGGRFDLANAQAFISGPLTSTLTARIAVRHDYQGDWQQSYTRPGDTRGKKDVSQARLLLDWKPTDRLRFELNANGWLDRSDTQAAQLVGRTANFVPLPAFAAYPLAPANARAADWSPNFPTARRDSFYQISLRTDYDLADTLKLTSLTSYSNLRIHSPSDGDGTALALDDVLVAGRIKSFNQELRLQGDMDGTRWVIGGDYSKDKIRERQFFTIRDGSTAIDTFPPNPDALTIRSDQKARTLAGFANVEHDFGTKLTVQGGIRYTDDKRDFTGCVADPGDGLFGASFANVYNFIFRPALGLPSNIVIPPGACVSGDATFTPVLSNLEQHQHNISWRGGVNYKPGRDALLYANVSRGYKAGTFPAVAGVAASQFTPTKQESVMAYETGFKLGLVDRRVQLNGAAFYYDYSNKQVRGKVLDPFYGTLEQLINVPKSRVYGAEIQLTARPVTGLTLNVGATYLKSKITRSFVNFSAYGSPLDFKGQGFPYTPKWQINADAQYDFPVSSKVNAFVGANVTYNDKTVGFFGADVPYNPADPQHSFLGTNPNLPVVAGALNIDSYALVDLRAGIRAEDGAWKLTVWGRNITNKYYWTNASYIPPDATVRFAGMPVTYGATMSFRY